MSVGSDAEVGDRVKLPLTFDVERMRAEVDAMRLRDFIYYDVMPLTAPAHQVDPSVERPPRGGGSYADGTWTEWRDTSALTSSPYLTEVVDTFREHTRVTLVRLLRLEPGGVIQPHTDPTLGLEVEDSVIRLTVPITSPEEVEFFLNDTVVPMRPGECWYMRLSDTHAVVNGSAEVRVNVTVDMEPNDWIRELIASSA